MISEYPSTLTREQLALDAAVEKIVALGEKVGMPPEEIAGLLNAGMDVPELLQHLLFKATERL